MAEDSHSVLVVTKDSKILSQLSVMLMAPMFELNSSRDFNEARRLCSERIYNIIIVDYSEGEGVDFAIDISSSSSTILLLVPNQHFDQISYRVESFGILTITSPFDQFYFYNMIKIAIAVQYKVQILSSQTIKLKNKMEEIRLVNRAKLIIMQKKSLSEEDAHHYIEKQAMDRSMKKIDVANEIINTLG